MTASGSRAAPPGCSPTIGSFASALAGRSPVPHPTTTHCALRRCARWFHQSRSPWRCGYHPVPSVSPQRAFCHGSESLSNPNNCLAGRLAAPALGGPASAPTPTAPARQRAQTQSFSKAKETECSPPGGRECGGFPALAPGAHRLRGSWRSHREWHPL